MGLIPPFIGAVVFTVLQFIVFLFVIVATPVAQFDPKSGSGCWTLFGFKNSCGSPGLDRTGTAAFGCVQRRNNMNGGAAFAIISIFTTLVALVFGVLMLLRISCAVFLPLLFTCLSVITILISWACVAGAYSIKMCNVYFYNGVNYGAGFGLMVTAWCLQVINVVVLVVLSFA
ncbi:amastin-like surface protein-like protein [Novymonas esmeraldas]|uniref:Amastin-like surface protein-like protein n=1 Tax=Novymonas esmeraldas TaxID=1808958 RepID=A0AAW0EYC9_9TRYP